MATTGFPAQPKHTGAVRLLLDVSKSQISPTYAVCLSNIIEKQEGCTVELQVPKRRHKPSSEHFGGTDSNAFSRRGYLATTDYSPRGFKIEVLTRYEKSYAPGGHGPREGCLRRRSIPLPSERMYFPNIIREDKTQQKMLERKDNKETAITVMQMEQDERKLASLRKEMKAKKYRGLLKSMNKVNRKNKAIRKAKEASKELELVSPEREIDLAAHKKRRGAGSGMT